jgi:hypothetical protein
MFGICRLALLPLRESSSHRSQMVSQLLFGEHYEVLDQQQDWFLIRNAFDGYTGFIARNQYTGIPEEYFKQIEVSDYKISLDLVSPILYKKERMPIVLGSILPFTGSELFKMEESMAFTGDSKPISQQIKMPLMKEMAMKYYNSPYLWGGRSPFGIDCSGFTQMVFRMCGYKLKRDSSQQATQGQEVEFGSHKPGDLAFFEEHGKINHVGLILEDNRIIHASGRVRIDRIDQRGILDEQNERTHHLSMVRKIM